MAIPDAQGLPSAVGFASASPHEVTHVEETLDNTFLAASIQRLIGDKAYDRNGLDERLLNERGIERVALNLSNRTRRTQDGHPLRRYRRRWKVQRLFAWLHNYRDLRSARTRVDQQPIDGELPSSRRRKLRLASR